MKVDTLELRFEAIRLGLSLEDEDRYVRQHSALLRRDEQKFGNMSERMAQVAIEGLDYVEYVRSVSAIKSYDIAGIDLIAGINVGVFVDQFRVGWTLEKPLIYVQVKSSGRAIEQEMELPGAQERMLDKGLVFISGQDSDYEMQGYFTERLLQVVAYWADRNR